MLIAAILYAMRASRLMPSIQKGARPICGPAPLERGSAELMRVHWQAKEQYWKQLRDGRCRRAYLTMETPDGSQRAEAKLGPDRTAATAALAPSPKQMRQLNVTRRPAV